MNIQEDQLVHAALESESLIPVEQNFPSMDLYINADIKGSNQLANLLKWLENRRQDTAASIAKQSKVSDKYWFMGAAAAFNAVSRYIIDNIKVSNGK